VKAGYHFAARSGTINAIYQLDGRNTMQTTRRRMIVTMTGAVAAALAPGRISAQANSQSHGEQPMSSPNAPKNQNAPVGLDGSEIPVHSGGRQLAPVTWVEIKSEAQKILDIATDFKWQVDRANLAATLPLLLIQEAHTLEKMAKQIQDHMKR
jgi:hypothetical protein